ISQSCDFLTCHSARLLDGLRLRESAGCWTEMGSVESYETASGRRYRVRYRDPNRRSREKAGFTTKREAEEHLASVTVSTLRGEYVDPAASRASVGDLGVAWLSTQTHLKPSAYKPLEVAWRKHVEPVW